MERWVIAFGEDIAEQVTAEQAHNTVVNPAHHHP